MAGLRRLLFPGFDVGRRYRVGVPAWPLLKQPARCTKSLRQHSHSRANNIKAQLKASCWMHAPLSALIRHAPRRLCSLDASTLHSVRSTDFGVLRWLQTAFDAGGLAYSSGADYQVDRQLVRRLPQNGGFQGLASGGDHSHPGGTAEEDRNLMFGNIFCRTRYACIRRWFERGGCLSWTSHCWSPISKSPPLSRALCHRNTCWQAWLPCSLRWLRGLPIEAWVDGLTSVCAKCSASGGRRSRFLSYARQTMQVSTSPDDGLQCRGEMAAAQTSQFCQPHGPAGAASQVKTTSDTLQL